MTWIVKRTETAMCQAHGVEFTRELQELEGGGFEHWVGYCPNCSQEQEARRLKRERHNQERAHRSTVARISDKANIPLRFRHAQFAQFVPRTKAQTAALKTTEKYVADFPENVKAGKSLTFLGPVGTGKTLLACSVANALIEHEIAVKYATAAEMIRDLRDCWRRGAEESTSEVLRRYTAPNLLVLDEVGMGFGTESELAQLTEVVDLRYRDLKPLLVITNLDRAGLEAALGERAVDRLRQDGIVAVFDGQSYRAETHDFNCSATNRG